MAGKKSVGVVLSGCGFLDGSEIHESVLTLLALDQAGANYEVYAPNESFKEVDHLSGSQTGVSRNVLVESARIARGKVKDFSQANHSEARAWIFPGGYGAAKNLCEFAELGENASVLPDVSRIVLGALESGVPIAACCIAPAMLALVTKNKKKPLTLTIGSDPLTAQALQNMGAVHENCAVDQCVADKQNKVVTAPAYMCDAGVSDVFKGIAKMVNQVLAWS